MDTGLFKWIWRFNAVGLAAITLFVCVMLFDEFSRDLFREERAPQTINIDPSDNTIEESLEMGTLYFDEQTGLVEFAVLRPQTYDVRGYGSGTGKTTYNNTVNRGYVDPATGETTWLLDHSDGLIVDWQLITRGNAELPRATAMLLRWITVDTTGDLRLSARDRGAVYMFEPGGENLTLLADDVGQMDGEFTFDETTEVVSLVMEGQRQLAYISLPERSIVKLLALPVLEP